MLLNPDFKDMLSAFNAVDVEYLVVGAYALAAAGTTDSDCQQLARLSACPLSGSEGPLRSTCSRAGIQRHLSALEMN